jgi:phospholipid transport system transporter-binding protein
VITRDGNRLRLQGALTLENVVSLCESGKQQFGDGDLIVDLSAVTEVDSSALSLLFEWRREAHRRQKQISFEQFPASLRSLATLYGVSDLVVSGP